LEGIKMRNAIFAESIGASASFEK